MLLKNFILNKIWIYGKPRIPLYVPFGIQRFARITSFGVSFSNSNT